MIEMNDSASSVSVRAAEASDEAGILALLPRLADFEVPIHRNAPDLWQGDARVIQAWLKGKRDDVVVLVAIEEADRVCGVAVASDREDLLTLAPSAHLEVLAVAEGMERRGIGRTLIAHIESAMRDRGAKGMSLHVFGNNTRARGLYQKLAYNEEIVRCFKPLK